MKNGGLVYYLHNGSPIFCHKQEDILGYRYICGNLVFNKLCTAVDLAKALGVNRRNIERYAMAIRENGSGYYLNKKDRRGQCHKMLPEVLVKAQELLDSGLSQLKTAKTLGVSESTIRGHIKKGNLKKKP